MVIAVSNTNVQNRPGPPPSLPAATLQTGQLQGRPVAVLPVQPPRRHALERLFLQAKDLVVRSVVAQRPSLARSGWAMHHAEGMVGLYTEQLCDALLQSRPDARRIAGLEASLARCGGLLVAGGRSVGEVLARSLASCLTRFDAVDIARLRAAVANVPMQASLAQALVPDLEARHPFQEVPPGPAGPWVGPDRMEVRSLPVAVRHDRPLGVCLDFFKDVSRGGFFIEDAQGNRSSLVDLENTRLASEERLDSAVQNLPRLLALCGGNADLMMAVSGCMHQAYMAPAVVASNARELWVSDGAGHRGPLVRAAVNHVMPEVVAYTARALDDGRVAVRYDWAMQGHQLMPLDSPDTEGDPVACGLVVRHMTYEVAVDSQGQVTPISPLRAATAVATQAQVPPVR